MQTSARNSVATAPDDCLRAESAGRRLRSASGSRQLEQGRRIGTEAALRPLGAGVTSTAEDAVFLPARPAPTLGGVLAARARPATASDLPVLEELYAELEFEMVALKPIWRLTDGLAEPVDRALGALIDGPGSGVLLGEIDRAPVGFLAWRHTPLLPQAGGALTAVIELIFTTPRARRVGVGETMITAFFEEADDRAIRLFDAIVPPGHRDAKNFFESNGFKARRIVMHRDDQ